MPNKQTEKEIAKQKAVKGGMPPNVADKVFKMSNDKVAYMAQVAGNPSMQMNPADRVMAEDPTTIKRPLYALESNKDLYTETSKSGETITYDTTKDGRSVIYSPGSAVPGNIMQRTSTSSRDDLFSSKNYSTNQNSAGGVFENQVLSSVNQIYTGNRRAMGDYKRQTSNQLRESNNMSYSNVDFRSSASTKNPYSGKEITFGSTNNVSNYSYDTNKSINDIKRLKHIFPHMQKSFVASNKVQKSINSSVKDWRSGSTPIKSSGDIVKVTGAKPQLLGSFAPNSVSGTPKKVSSKKPPRQKKGFGGLINPLNVIQYAGTFLSGNKYKRRDMEQRGYTQLIGNRQVNPGQTYRGNSGW